MKCTKCGSTMIKSVGDHAYRESGMDHVILRNITKYHCDHCGAKNVQIVAMAQLHRLLAELIARKPARLVPSEVRFIRDHLELSNKDFAVLMGVSETQASRWTNSEPIGVLAERFLRMLATIGPIVLASRDAPKSVLGKVNGGEFVADVAETLHRLPSGDEPVKEIPIKVRRSNSDWKPEPQVAAN
jgi:putative zinc finger/helix-turn-helix YgiT family protein